MSKNKNLPLVLVILDGWGVWKETEGNAIALAKTPVMNSLYKKYPNILINASGKYVGLPTEQPGNSEAGHMNIGAGRIIEQDAITISKSINNGTFFKNPAFLQAVKHVSKYNSDIHLMGLLSDGSSPHADNDHLLSLLSLFVNKTKANIYLHLFTDGRDSPQFAALKILEKYKNIFERQRIKIATIMGRFYPMDRKKSWDRTELAFNALVKGEGIKVESAAEGVSQAYNRGESDEFIQPTVVFENKKPVATIKDQDAIIFFNLRSDRARQLSKVFVQKDFEKKNPGSFKRGKVFKDLLFVALTDFGPDLDSILTAFPGIDIPETLPIALRDLRQLYLAETEKYAHVTYFFNGGYDHVVAGEERVEIASKDVDSYAKVPEMSSKELSTYVVKSVIQNKFDFICVNFASPDMVGHTGDLKAGIKAVEVVDQELGKIIEAVKKVKGTVIVTADHGNVEEMINLKTKEVDTEHSVNLVPFIVISNQKYQLKKTGVLANIAPTILDILGLTKPKLMKEKSLIKS
ncbi:2,3-bisphosphoglycerate-independent phosphoglycerate mutase [Candidatus Nomurabacteria bacterium]|nr:2,3-bisphosphoglycerate-independent phosphoglycerate mutase [Candidatus Nomurabacteria bacterium]